MKKLTLNDFIQKARQVHGDKYDYSKVEYVNNSTKVCIICPIHGEFWQTPRSHLNGNGCPKCTKNQKLTTETFIQKARQVHGNKYDYSKVEYVNSDAKVCIICPIHGEFWMTPNHHLSGKQGCPKCAHRSYAYTTEEFIIEAKKIHGDKYDYSKVVYTNAHTKVCIICPIHGEFWQKSFKHLQGQGCPKCRKNNKLTLEEFIDRAKKIHGDKYDYSKVEYVNNSTKVCIICPIHGEFWQTPHGHLNGKGCNKCHEEFNVSETKLYDFIQNNISEKILREYKFDFLKGKSLDIYIPSKSIAIEYQGIQHFKPVEYFGGINRFKDNIKRDKEKYEECKKHNIKLFYFTYEKNVPKSYIDKIYTNENDLLNEINDYANNRRLKTSIPSRENSSRISNSTYPVG